MLTVVKLEFRTIHICDSFHLSNSLDLNHSENLLKNQNPQKDHFDRGREEAGREKG